MPHVFTNPVSSSTRHRAICQSDFLSARSASTRSHTAALDPGIISTGVVTAQLNGAGSIGFVQIVKADRRLTLDNGDKVKITSNGQYVLDRENNPGNIVQHEKTAINESQLKIILFDDSPYNTLAGYQSVSVDETFQLYLMYQPSGVKSIWVTLRRLDWYWKGVATKNNGMWIIDPNSNEASADDDGIDTTELPKWESRVQDIDPVEDNG